MTRARGRRVHLASTAKAPADAVHARGSSGYRRDIWLLGAVLLGVAVYRFVMLSGQAGPPGSDPGNWLAYTQALFGHSPKLATDSMYFPGALAVLKGLLIFLPDLLALKTLAVLSSVAAGVPFYLLARRACGPVTSAFLTLLLLMAGFLIEMMAWGGYPQLLGTAYLLLSLYFLDRWLLDGDRRSLYGAAVSTGLVFATHHFTVLFLFASFAVYLPFIAWRERARLREIVKRGLIYAAAGGGLSLLTLPWYLQYASYLAGNGSINPSAGQLRSLGDVLSFVFAEAPLTWIALGTIVPIVALLPLGGAGVARLRPIAVALTVGPLLVYAATHEPRSFQPMQAGILLCLGVVIAVWCDILVAKGVRRPVLHTAQLVQAIAALALLLIILPGSNTRFKAARTHYDAVDEQTVQALDWLRDQTPPNAIVLPSDHSGVVNYSWWIEGYSRRRAYGLIDPNYLAFKQERAQSEIARRIIDKETPVAEAEMLLRETGIRYLFIYKPTGGAFQELVNRVPVYLSFENRDYAILRIAGPVSATRE